MSPRCFEPSDTIVTICRLPRRVARRRAALFAERADEILRFHGRRYLEAREQFIDAYTNLMSHRDVLDEWMDESRRGVRPRAGDLRERRELVAALLRVRDSR